jgi:hypothetical protein
MIDLLSIVVDAIDWVFKCQKLFIYLSHSKNVNIIWTQCYKTFYTYNLRIFVISWSVCSWQALLSLV